MFKRLRQLFNRHTARILRETNIPEEFQESIKEHIKWLKEDVFKTLRENENTNGFREDNVSTSNESEL